MTDNEKIFALIESFDFDKVAIAVKLLNLKWTMIDGNKRIPTKDEIVVSALNLLQELAKLPKMDNIYKMQNERLVAERKVLYGEDTYSLRFIIDEKSTFE